MIRTSILGLITAAFLCTLSLTSAITQKRGPRFPKAVQQTARQTLQSPKAKYLSGSGRNVLSLISNNVEISKEGISDDSSLNLSGMQQSQERRDENRDGNEVMVNNPLMDTFTFTLDISTQSETAVAARGRNVVVAYNDSGEIPLSGGLTGYSISTDGGHTFDDRGPMPNSASGFNLGDPGLVSDGVGNFYSSFVDVDLAQPPGFEFTIGVSKSTDGTNFGTPVLVPVTSLTPGSFEDKPFIAADTSGGPNRGNIYITFTNFNPDPNLGFPIALSRSIDGGISFSNPIFVSAPTDFCQGAEPIVGPNGEIYIAYQKFSPGTPGIFVAKSVDGGQSFGTAVLAAPLETIGFAGGTLLGNFGVNSYPRVDVNPRNGNVYVVYSSNPPGPDGSDVFFTRSTNGGVTWSPAIRVNDDATENDQFFPDIAVTADGVLEIIWYDKRHDSNNLNLEVFSARSANGGRSFAHNRAVTSESFPPAPAGYDPLLSSTYMGDYLDIKASGESFILAWGDNRRKITTLGGTRNDQDVFFAKH